MGGHAFLQEHLTPGVVAPRHTQLAHNVLCKWIAEKPRDASRGALYDVLVEVDFSTAEAFQMQLIG